MLLMIVLLPILSSTTYRVCTHPSIKEGFDMSLLLFGQVRASRIVREEEQTELVHRARFEAKFTCMSPERS